jgi:hypothetical protein
MPFVAVPGHIQISTYVDGSADNPWLVLSNSLAATHSMWDLQMKTLLKRYRVLRYDTRGHGQSDVPAAPYSFDDLVGDAVALLDHYQIERGTFMGLSRWRRLFVAMLEQMLHRSSCKAGTSGLTRCAEEGWRLYFQRPLSVGFQRHFERPILTSWPTSSA